MSNMKSTVIAICLVGAVNYTFIYLFVLHNIDVNLQVFAQTKMGPSCGPPPTKMPTDCCENLDKLVKPEVLSSCHAQCGMNPCCEGDCFAKALGFAKDGKFDKETTIKALNTVFSANTEWQPVSF